MEKTNIIKISREFKDNVLGSIWLGREVELREGGDPIIAFEQLNEELVNAYGRLSGRNDVVRDGLYVMPPHRTNPTVSVDTLPTIQVSKTDKAIQGIKEEIESCKDITTLETYRKIARTDETLKVAYYDTLSKLSTNQ